MSEDVNIMSSSVNMNISSKENSFKKLVFQPINRSRFEPARLLSPITPILFFLSLFGQENLF